MPRVRDLLFLAGRGVVGGYFVYNGLNHVRNVKQMAGYAESKEVKTPNLAVLGSGALLLAGGVSIITGWRPKVGLACAAVFFGGVTPKMHAFWKIDDDEQRMIEQINFTKNIALLGAVQALAAVREPWPLSIDAAKAKRKREPVGTLEPRTRTATPPPSRRVRAREELQTAPM